MGYPSKITRETPIHFSQDLLKSKILKEQPEVINEGRTADI